MFYKLIVSCLLLNSNLIFGIESKTGEPKDMFAGVRAASAGRESAIVFVEPEELLGMQVRTMFGQSGLFYRKVGEVKANQATARDPLIYEAVIKVADALDESNRVRLEARRLDSIQAKIDRRYSGLLNCCTTTIALGSLGLSIFSAYWATAHHQRIA